MITTAVSVWKASATRRAAGDSTACASRRGSTACPIRTPASPRPRRSRHRLLRRRLRHRKTLPRPHHPVARKRPPRARARSPQPLLPRRRRRSRPAPGSIRTLRLRSPSRPRPPSGERQFSAHTSIDTSSSESPKRTLTRIGRQQTLQSSMYVCSGPPPGSGQVSTGSPQYGQSGATDSRRVMRSPCHSPGITPRGSRFRRRRWTTSSWASAWEWASRRASQLSRSRRDPARA